MGAFYTAMKQLVPTFCKNRKIWLPSDTTMVSPSLLVKHGVSVSRAVQQPGQFVVVFPKSYTSSLCTGYCVSESVYYAPVDWLVDVDSVFMDIKDSQEPMMFPLEKMLFALAADSRATKFVLETIKPKIEKIRDRESELRKQVISLGIKVSERLSLENDSSKEEEDDEYECHVCNANLFVSLIANVDEENTYCLAHGIEYITENKQMVKSCKMLYTHTLEEIKEVLKKLEERLNNAIYIDEPEEDIPLREDDVVDVEEEDYVDEDDIKQRERAIPSYIKKEKKPLISSESEDNEEEEAQDEGPQIGAGDFLEDFPDDVDLPVIEALFGEDDEIVRPSSKRKAPRVRKITESSEENSGDESEDEDTAQRKKAEQEKKKKEEAKAKALAKAKEIEMRKKEVERRKKEIEMRKAQKEKEKQEKAAEKERLKKRKLEQAAASSSKANSKKKRKDSQNEDDKMDTDSDSQLRKDQNKKNQTKKGENSREKKDVKPTSKLKEPREKGEKKKENKKIIPSKKSKEEKLPIKNRKKDTKEDKSRQRKSKKRKAKSMDTADQFNLLDIILTETDDENYCSVSEKESEETSSDEEYWK